jgi:hypothetical protein
MKRSNWFVVLMMVTMVGFSQGFARADAVEEARQAASDAMDNCQAGEAGDAKEDAMDQSQISSGAYTEGIQRLASTVQRYNNLSAAPPAGLGPNQSVVDSLAEALSALDEASDYLNNPEEGSADFIAFIAIGDIAYDDGSTQRGYGESAYNSAQAIAGYPGSETVRIGLYNEAISYFNTAKNFFLIAIEAYNEARTQANNAAQAVANANGILDELDDVLDAAERNGYWSL